MTSQDSLFRHVASGILGLLPTRANKGDLLGRLRDHATVYDTAFQPLMHAGLPVVDERIPFPGSGQQVRFGYVFDRALRSIGWGRSR